MHNFTRLNSARVNITRLNSLTKHNSTSVKCTRLHSTRLNSPKCNPTIDNVTRLNTRCSHVQVNFRRLYITHNIKARSFSSCPKYGSWITKPLLQPVSTRCIRSSSTSVTSQPRPRHRLLMLIAGLTLAVSGYYYYLEERQKRQLRVVSGGFIRFLRYV